MSGSADDATALSVDEAVELATALVQHLARRAGARMLVVKGPLSARQSLRGRERSSDVDVIVEPSGYAQLFADLEAHGWSPRPLPDFPRLMDRHSRTFIKQGWNCDIDVHHYWPGFLADPERAFDALWAERESMRFGQADIDVPSVPGAALVLALHSLREAGFVDPGSRQMVEYRQLIERCRARDDAEAFAARVHQLARETGAEQTAAPFLSALGRTPGGTVPDEVAWRQWQLHTRAEHPVTAWLVELRESPWWRKPSVVWHGLFPRAHELRAIDPQIGEGRLEVARGWWRRFVRGVRAVPAAGRMLRSMRR